MDTNGEYELTYKWKNRNRWVFGKILYNMAVLVEGQHEAWHTQALPDPNVTDNVGMSKLAPCLLTRSAIIRESVSKILEEGQAHLEKLSLLAIVNGNTSQDCNGHRAISVQISFDNVSARCQCKGLIEKLQSLPRNCIRKFQ